MGSARKSSDKQRAGVRSQKTEEKPEPTASIAPRRVGEGSSEAVSRLWHVGMAAFLPTYHLPLFTYLPGRVGRDLRKGE